MSNKILIVDDNDEFRKIISEFVKSLGLDMEVFEAYTGEMAIAKSSFIQPDIIIMDINLPNMNGLEATRQIKIDNPNCDLVILTMFDVDVFKKTAQEIDVRDYIAKSEAFDRLPKVLKACIEEKNKI
ncbi:MAG: response regulator [Candidatus Omnitrophica bacterium]|nr:response regulator [Candidatus Omnitrophota bacterium]